MTDRSREILAALLLVAAAIACSDSMGSADDDDDDDSSGPCRMIISVQDPVGDAPTRVYLTGSIDTEVSFDERRTYDWAVYFSGDGSSPAPEVGPDGTSMSFQADAEGAYTVTLDGSVAGEPCLADEAWVNVSDPGAPEVTYRLRFVPSPDHGAPPQDKTVSVPGGVDRNLGTFALEPGRAVVGQVTGPGDAPLAAYLRVTDTGGDLAPIEGFSGSDGSFSLILGEGQYDVLVVPGDGGLAPRLFRELALADIEDGLALDEGSELTGAVLASAGEALADARVLVRIDGVPSTLATTDAAGELVLAVRPGDGPGVLDIAVVPATADLPVLTLAEAEGVSLAGSSTLTIQYAEASPARSESFDIVASDGITPVSGARVLIASRPLVAAGTAVREDGSSIALSGSVRVDATADTDGTVGPVNLPAAEYDVVILPPPGTESTGLGTARIFALDLTGSESVAPVIELAEGASVQAAILPASVAVRAAAVPQGLLARAAAPTVEVVSTGSVSLPLAGEGEYEVTLDPAAEDDGWARSRMTITAPPGGEASELGRIQLVPAFVLTGRVTVTGETNAPVGVHVSIYCGDCTLCGDCTVDEAEIPLAETSTGEGGSFALRVPEPPDQ